MLRVPMSCGGRAPAELMVPTDRAGADVPSGTRVTSTSKPPRAMAWLLLLASASAVLLTGVAGTTIILANSGASFGPVAPAFWLELAMAAALTVTSLALRSLRWIFLLRRSETRIPIRDAYIGYFAGLSLLLAPLLLGEIAVRASILRARGDVPLATTVVVNLWERLLDLVALGLLAALTGLALRRIDLATVGLLAGSAATLMFGVRRFCLRAAVGLARPVARVFDGNRLAVFDQLATARTWTVALAASFLAWMLPGIGLWRLAGTWGHPFGAFEAQHAYASSAGLGGLVFAPGGVLVAGTYLLEVLLEAARQSGRAYRRRRPHRHSGSGERSRRRICSDPLQVDAGGLGVTFRRDRGRVRRADSRGAPGGTARAEDGADARRDRSAGGRAPRTGRRVRPGNIRGSDARARI